MITFGFVSRFILNERLSLMMSSRFLTSVTSVRLSSRRTFIRVFLCLCHHPDHWITLASSVGILEKVAIVESWLGGDGRRLKVLVVVECRMIKVPVIVEVRLREVNASLLLRLVVLARRLNVRMMIDFDWLSYLRFVLPSAHAALDADHVAGLERRITPQARHQERQQRQSDPAFGAADLLGSVAAARARMVDEIAFGVAHAVIQHAARANHPRYRVDAAFYAIWCKCARAFSVPLFLVKFLAISEVKFKLKQMQTNDQ